MKPQHVFRLLSGFAVLVSMIFFQSSCESLGGGYKVEYEVTGDATFVSYFTEDGEQEESGISTPWTHSFRTRDEGQSVSLRAGSGGGTVYVTVYLDGEQVLSTWESGGLTAITGTYTIADLL